MGTLRRRVSDQLRIVRTARSRAARDDDGFTLLELIVAISVVAVVLTAVAHGMYGGMRVLMASQQKTAFTELATAEMELLRGMPYDNVGVNTTDPFYATAYPGGQYEGRDAVVHSPANPDAPPIRTIVTDGPVRGAERYTVDRRITWTDATGGSGHAFKRLEVVVEWRTPSGRAQTLRLDSVSYPGNLGELPVVTPAAAFVVTPTTGLEDTQIFTVNGSTSSNPTGGPLTYAWNWGDGTTATGVTASKVYADPGPYTIALTVTNSAGVSSAPATRNVVVTSPVVPTASFTTSPATGTSPLTVTVNASASTDPNGDPLTYAWNFGDGTTGSGVVTTVTYTTQATYTITLTVADPAGNTDSTTRQVVVNPPACRVNSASFLQQPRTVANDILVATNGKPASSQRTFTFTASTTAQCTTVTYSVPTASGSMSVIMGLTASSPTTKSWTGTTSVSASDRFSTGSLTANVKAVGPSFTHEFSHPALVHT